MKKQNIVKIALEAHSYEDPDVTELRKEQKRLAIEAHMMKPNKLQAQYFHIDNTCIEHDRVYCSQCQRYVDGRGHPDESL
jgi:hypothetical protein